MLLALLICPPALAASPHVALGYTHRAQRDLHHSPLRYDGHAPTLQLGLDGAVVDVWLDVSLVHWNPAGVGPRDLRIHRTDPLTGADASFVVSVPHWGQAGLLGAQAAWPVGPVHLGPRVTTRAHYATLAMATWALHETSADVRVSWTRDAWTVGGWLPVVALHTRMPYGLDPLIQGRSQVASFFASGTTAQSWGRRQAVGADVAYRHPGERWDLGVTASVAWSHSAVPDTLVALDGQVLVTAWRAP